MSFSAKKPLVKQRTIYDERDSKTKSNSKQTGLSSSQKRVSFEKMNAGSGSDEENSQGRHNREASVKKKSGDDLLDLFRSGKSVSDGDDDVEIGGKGKTHKDKGQPKPVPRHTRPGLSPRGSHDLGTSIGSAPQKQKPTVSPRSSRQHSLEDGDDSRHSSSKTKPKPPPRVSTQDEGRSRQAKPAVPSRRKGSFEDGEGKGGPGRPRTGSKTGKDDEKINSVRGKGSLSRTKSKSLDDSDEDDDIIIQGGREKTRVDSKRTITPPVPRDRETRGKAIIRQESNGDTKRSEKASVQVKHRVWNELDSEESEEEAGNKKVSSKIQQRDSSFKNESMLRKSKSRSFEDEDHLGEGSHVNRTGKPVAPMRSPRTRKDESIRTLDGKSMSRKPKSYAEESEDDEDQSNLKNKDKPVPLSRGKTKGDSAMRSKDRKGLTHEESEEEDIITRGEKPFVSLRGTKEETSTYLDDDSDDDEFDRKKVERTVQGKKEKDDGGSLFVKFKSMLSSQDDSEKLVQLQRRQDNEAGAPVFGKRMSRYDGDEHSVSKYGEKVTPMPRAHKSEKDGSYKGPSKMKSKLSYLEDTDSDDDDDDETEKGRQGKRVTPVPREKALREQGLGNSISNRNDDEHYIDRTQANSPPRPKRRTRVVHDDDAVAYDDTDGRFRKGKSGTRLHGKGSLDSDDEDEIEQDYLKSKRKMRPASAKERGFEKSLGSRPKPSLRSKTPTPSRERNGDMNHAEPAAHQRSGGMKKSSSYDALPTKQHSKQGTLQSGPDGRRGQGAPMKKALTPQRPGSGRRNEPVWSAEKDRPDHHDMSDEEDQWTQQPGSQRHPNFLTPKMRGPMRAERGIGEMTRSPQLQQRATYRNDEYVDDFSPRYKTQGTLGQHRSSSMTNLRGGSAAEDSDDGEYQRRNSLDTVTIRQAVYDNWLSRKNVTLKKQLSKKALEKQRQEEKEREEKERRRSAKLAFQSWNEKKADTIKEQQEKLKAKKKEEQEKELEKRIKAKDAKKYFESWKSKKDEELKGTHREKKTEIKTKKEKEEEEKREKVVASKKTFENWKAKKDEKLKQEHKEKKRKEKTESEKLEDASYEKAIKSADEFQKWVEKKGKARPAPPPPTLTQRAWVPGSRHTADCIPGAVQPVIQPPTPNRARTLSASNRYQSMKMYDYR